MNNPARAWLQQAYEVPLPRRLGARLAGSRAVGHGFTLPQPAVTRFFDDVILGVAVDGAQTMSARP